jgi:hypothetical protein
MGFLDWFATTFGQGDHVAESRSRELEAADARRAGLTREREAYFGTSTPVVDEETGSELDPATGRPFQTTTGGTESHDTGGWGFSWLDETWRSITGQTRTASGVDSETGAPVRTVDEDRTTVAVDPVAGRLSGSDTRRDVVQQLDVAGMAGNARSELQRQLREEGPHLGEAERHALERDIAALENADETTLTRIIRDRNLRIREQYATVGGTESTTTGSVGRDGTGFSADASHADTVHTGADRSTTTTTAVSAEADALAGTAGVSGRHAVSERSGDITETAEVSGGGSVAMGDGAMTVTGRRGVSASRVRGEGDDAVTELGMRQEDATSVSVVGGDRGHGLGMGSESTRAVTVGGVEASRTDRASGAVTDRGVFGAASTERSVGGRRGSVTSRASVDGSFTVDVEAIEGSVPPQYRVVMTLSAGAGMRLGGTRRSGPATEGDRWSAGGHAEATGGVAMTYRHVMDEVEAQQYMSEVDEADAGGEASGHPEFGLISRLRAIGNEGDQAAIGGAAVLGSSEAGAMLGDGESIELTLTGAVELGVTGSGTRGAYGGSASASHRESWTRTVRIERVAEHQSAGQHLVDVTVSFVAADRTQGSASATVEAVSLGVEGEGTSSETESVVVRLDTAAPDYQDRYGQVCAAMDPATLRSLAREYTEATADSQRVQGSMGLGGVALEVGSTDAGSESVTHGEGGTASGTFSGGVTDRGAISVAGTDVLQDSERNTATVTVDESGTEATLETERASSDFWRSVSEGAGAAWDAVTGLFDGEGNAATEAADMVSESPADRLQEQLETTYSDLEQYSLSEADLDTLVTRAGNASAWDACCNDLDTYPIWQGLRSSLRRPAIDPQWADVDRAQAERLARGRAIAGFMRASGDDGMTCMVNVLRYYGQRGGYTSERDIGTHLEWPESLSGARTKFNAAHGRIRRIDHELSMFIGRADGMSRAQAWYDDTVHKLDDAEAAIRASTDIVDRSARMEMLEACLRERHALEEGFERNRHALEAGVAESAARPETESAEPEVCLTSDAEVDMSVAPPLTPEQVRSQREIAEKMGLLVGYKGEETAAFAEARGNMSTEHGGTDGGFFSAFTTNYRDAYTVVQSGLSQLYENWIRVILELRALYQAAGTPAAEWVVSSGPGQRRNRSYEPDVETRVTIMRQCCEAWSSIDYAWRDHISAYRAQVAGY